MLDFDDDIAKIKQALELYGLTLSKAKNTRGNAGKTPEFCLALGLAAVEFGCNEPVEKSR